MIYHRSLYRMINNKRCFLPTTACQHCFVNIRQYVQNIHIYRHITTALFSLDSYQNCASSEAYNFDVVEY